MALIAEHDPRLEEIAASYPDDADTREGEFVNKGEFSWHKDPDSIRTCQGWMTRIGEHIAERNRMLGEINRGARIMDPESGLYLSPEGLAIYRGNMIRQKNKLIARQQYLRNWRTGRIRAAQEGRIQDPDVDTKINKHHQFSVQAMRAAAKRYGLLEGFFDLFTEYLEIEDNPDASEADVANRWAALTDQHAAIARHGQEEGVSS